MPDQAVNIDIIRLPHAQGLELPAYETAGAAGFDLRAAMAEEDHWILEPMQRLLVPTGLCLALPQGYEMQIRPRSGLAYKNGISVLNSPGTIDSDYRGEIQVLLINLSQENFPISRGLRIAQALIAPVVRAKLQLTAKLSDTLRGTGGFGSTGEK